MKTKRRIEITVFRRQRVAINEATRASSSPTSATEIEERLVAEIAMLVKQLTKESRDPANSRSTSSSEPDDC